MSALTDCDREWILENKVIKILNLSREIRDSLMSLLEIVVVEFLCCRLNLGGGGGPFVHLKKARKNWETWNLAYIYHN